MATTNQPTSQQLLVLALQHHQAGRLPEAEQLYRQVLALKPDSPDALHLLGVLAHQAGRCDAGVELIRRAIAFQPDSPQVHFNLAKAHADMLRLDDAAIAFRQAIALKPDYIDAFYNLGIVLRDKGEVSEAIAAFRRAIALNPRFAQAWVNLGLALRDNRQLDDAIAAFRQAIALSPGLAEAHSNLAVTLTNKGQLDEAIAATRQAIALRPDYPEAWNNLGVALKDSGRAEEAAPAFRRAVVLNPAYADAHSNLLMCLRYAADTDPAVLFAEHRLWNRQHAEPLKRFFLPHSNSRDPNRRLRIGYVSADLRQHPVGRFLFPVLQHHVHQHVELFCYASQLHHDDLTERMANVADIWRNVKTLSDSRLADLVRQDQIDILVDLSLHSAGNRLLAFARKPAPVQVSWLGFPGTTGMDAIDCKLADRYCDPPGQNDAFYSEHLFRLPEVAAVYQPTTPTPDVNPLPALASGRVTFGCLNNFCKVSPRTMAVWARILRSLPQADLLLHVYNGLPRSTTRAVFQAAGVDPARIDFVGRGGPKYFEFFHRMDISLDPFPFCGSTTTCESLWMGVPVVTLAGSTDFSRMGLSILSCAGLSEWVTRTEEAYVETAVALASNLPRLAELRRTLRQQIHASPLMDAPRLARDVEAAYRQMWQRWCATAGK